MIRLELHFTEEISMIFEDLVKAGFFARNVIPFQFLATTKGGSEGEIGGSPSLAVYIYGADGDKCESGFLLFAQANGCDRSFFRIPKQAEVLMHAGPIPATIGDVLEAGFFHAGSGFDRIREK